MRTGRPPKPIEQKRRTGNPGKRKLPDRSNLAVVPAVEPSIFDLSPLDALERVVEQGVVWLAQTDAPTLALLRDALEDYELARSSVVDWKSLVELRKQIQSLLSQLGFDPTARARLGLAEVKARSKLDELRERRAKVVDTDDE